MKFKYLVTVYKSKEIYFNYEKERTLCFCFGSTPAEFM